MTVVAFSRARAAHRKSQCVSQHLQHEWPFLAAALLKSLSHTHGVTPMQWEDLRDVAAGYIADQGMIAVELPPYEPDAVKTWLLGIIPFDRVILH